MDNSRRAESSSPSGRPGCKPEAKTVRTGRDIALTLLLICVLLVLYFLPSATNNDQVTTDSAQRVTPGYSGEAPGHSLSQSSRAQLQYVREVFPIISSWDVSLIQRQLVEPTRSSLSHGQLTEVTAVLARTLGQLKSYTDPVRSHIETLDDSATLAVFSFMAKFEKDSADVTLRVIDRDGEMGLLAFTVSVSEATTV